VLNVYFFSVALISIPIIYVAYFYFNIAHVFIYWELAVLLFSTIYFSTWFQTLCPSLNLLERRRAFVAFNLFAQALGLMLAVVGVFVLRRTAFVWLSGILLGQVAGVFVCYWYFSTRLISKFAQYGRGYQSELFLNRTVWYFCFPVAITTALMWTQNQSYRILIESNLGAEALAVLGVGLGIATSIAGLVESMVSQYFYPRFYANLAGDAQDARVRAWTKLYLNALSVYVPTMIFVVCSAKFILKILVNSKFEDCLSLVMWGAAIEFCRMMTNIIYMVSQAEMKMKATVVPYFSGAVIVLGGFVVALHFFNSIALQLAPVILTVAAVTVMVSMFVKMRHVLPIQAHLNFVRKALIWSAPFSIALLAYRLPSSFPISLAIVAVTGSALLVVIWKLQLDLLSRATELPR